VFTGPQAGQDPATPAGYGIPNSPDIDSLYRSVWRIVRKVEITGGRYYQPAAFPAQEPSGFPTTPPSGIDRAYPGAGFPTDMRADCFLVRVTVWTAEGTMSEPRYHHQIVTVIGRK